MTTVTVNHVDPVSTPRGAEWAANLFSTVLASLHALGHPAPSPEDPSLMLGDEHARHIDAMRVRSYASAIAAEDPRYAADLYAAADRHERGM